MTPQAAPHPLEAEHAAAAKRELRARSLLYVAQRLNLTASAKYAAALVAERTAHATNLRERCRDLRLLEGRCLRCGFRPTHIAALCADCADDLAS